MKVLVTGSLGNIGSKVISALPDRFDLMLTDLREGDISGRPVRALDITDYDAVLAASRGMDAILHLAIASEGCFKVGEHSGYLQFNEGSIDTNVRGTYHVYEAARQNGVPRVVYGSSLTVLLGTPDYEAVNDALDPRPSNFYAVTKLWGEQLGEFFSRHYRLRVYCLRFGTPHPWKDHPCYQNWVLGSRRTLVTYEDLAGSMSAALEADGPMFGTYTIMSDGPERIFDFSKASEIGWAPQDFVEADGEVRPVTRWKSQLVPA